MQAWANQSNIYFLKIKLESYMNKKIARLWADALRSGKYEQGKSALARKEEDKTSYCCLGVLCELAIENGIKIEKSIFGECDYGELVGYNSSTATLPPVVKEWAFENTNNFALIQDDFISYNDTKGLTFDQIADIIEERFINV
jgi:hypothetical protein